MTAVILIHPAIRRAPRVDHRARIEHITDKLLEALEKVDEGGPTDEYQRVANELMRRVRANAGK